MNREPRTERMRLVTIGLDNNLSQIRWAWERPTKAHKQVSVQTQLVMTLLTLVAVCPLEEMLNDLADDPLTTRKKDAVSIPDLMAGTPDGFLTHLASWRQAVGSGRVELYTTEDGRRLAGLRAWLPPTTDSEGWSMTLDVEHLSSIVHGLLGALPYWGIPLEVMPRSGKP